MTSPITSTPVRLSDLMSSTDHPTVLGAQDWAGYQALRTLRGDHRRPKLAYLDGAVELMPTSRAHETIKRCIGTLIEVFCHERRIPWSSYGNWTLDDESDAVGVEPDECYVFDPEPRSKPRPDLAIEVVLTSGGLDKLEIYRRLGVREVWFWKGNAITVHTLAVRGYEPRHSSTCLPGIDLALVSTLASIEPMSEAAEQFRAMLHS